jgi:hypothetical protein
MEINLNEYIEKEKAEASKLADEMKNYIFKIRDLEIKRLENFQNSGVNKIKELNLEAQMVFKIYNNCQNDLSERDNDVSTFAKLSTETKIEYLKKIQRKSSELKENSKRIEKVVEKFRNVKEYDVYKLLETNKDYSYYTNFAKLKYIFFKKIKNLENKIGSENCKILIEGMESLKFKSNNSKVYNKYLNLDYGEKPIERIYQPIDSTSTLNVFNVKEKNVFEKDVHFTQNDEEKSEINFFPKFSRSINILGKLYVTGGEIYNRVLNNLIEVDCEKFEAKEKCKMKFTRSAHTLVNISNLKIVAISGAYGETSCEEYSIEKDKWSRLPSVKKDRIGASALVFSSESINLFFGKRYDIENKIWNFVDTIEKIDLFNGYPVWSEINLKITSADVNRQLAFCGLIASPNEKVYLLGGQAVVNDNIQLSDQILEIDLDRNTMGACTHIKMPKQTLFIDNNFYFYNFNAINFDNQGSCFLYSVIFKDLWMI